MYYVREDLMKRAGCVAREHLVSLGTCLGKFTHHENFRLTIGALDVLAKHAKNKVRFPPPPAPPSDSRAHTRGRTNVFSVFNRNLA